MILRRSRIDTSLSASTADALGIGCASVGQNGSTKSKTTGGLPNANGDEKCRRSDWFFNAGTASDVDLSADTQITADSSRKDDVGQ